MAGNVSNFLERVKPDKPFWRANWGTWLRQDSTRASIRVIKPWLVRMCDWVFNV